MFAIFSVITTCLRQILAVLAGTCDNQPLDNGNSGEKTVRIGVDARAVTASRSTESDKPLLIAGAKGEDSSSNSKGGSQNGDEISSSNDSDKTGKKEKWEKRAKRAKRIQKENKERDEALKAKGLQYQYYDPNEIAVD
ncbi:MAG: hypothetical protein M1821_007464 [Bathelium mastoideum]|nr:MAG: hypothetical protein M1821_007464 [Bathelium mastoideum]